MAKRMNPIGEGFSSKAKKAFEDIFQDKPDSSFDRATVEKLYNSSTIWVIFLVFLYILFNNYYENRIRQKSIITAKIDSVRALYLTKQSDFAQQTKKSTIQLKVEKLGMEENKNAPNKIVSK
jgi:hypothetical protein